MNPTTPNAPHDPALIHNPPWTGLPRLRGWHAADHATKTLEGQAVQA